MSARASRRSRALALRLACLVFAPAMLAALATVGCRNDRVDLPADDGKTVAAAAPDSLAAWAQRARELWATGDTMQADVAGALAREAFQGGWAQAADDRQSAQQATTSERLPTVDQGGAPTPAEVIDQLTRVGLAADVTEARGKPVLWQVVVSDPVGSSHAETEFWAWPDARVSGATPIVQTLPARAPARAGYGPDAVGDLVTWSTNDGARLASAWGRPRSHNGIEVAVASRKKGDASTWTVTSNHVLPIESDSAYFDPAAGGGSVPALMVSGAGERDAMFDECPTCPHLQRLQRYVLRGDDWVLSEERIKPTPYAAFNAFLHALRQGMPEAALPYAAGPAVIEQAQSLGLDIRRGQLRAAPGTTDADVTQRYRTGGTEAVEVTLQRSGDHWVVIDVRPTQIIIE